MGLKPPAITQTYHFDASPERMFKYLTDPKDLTKWFLGRAQIKPKTGSSYKFTWRGGFSHTGRVKKAVPDKSLTLTWPDKIKGKVYETQVSFLIAKKGKGCVVKLRHIGFEEGADWLWLFGAIQSGWAYYMTNLKSVADHGTDLRSDFDSP